MKSCYLHSYNFTELLLLGVAQPLCLWEFRCHTYTRFVLFSLHLSTPPLWYFRWITTHFFSLASPRTACHYSRTCCKSIKHSYANKTWSEAFIATSVALKAISNCFPTIYLQPKYRKTGNFDGVKIWQLRLKTRYFLIWRWQSSPYTFSICISNVLEF